MDILRKAESKVFYLNRYTLSHSPVSSTMDRPRIRNTEEEISEAAMEVTPVMVEEPTKVH